MYFSGLFCLSFGYSVKKIICKGRRFPSRVSKCFLKFSAIAWKGGVCCLSGSTHLLGIPISTHANSGVIRQSKMLAAKKEEEEEKEFRRPYPKIRLPQLGGKDMANGWSSSWADAFVRSRHLRTEREEEVECGSRHFRSLHIHIMGYSSAFIFCPFSFCAKFF